MVEMDDELVLIITIVIAVVVCVLYTICCCVLFNVFATVYVIEFIKDELQLFFDLFHSPDKDKRSPSRMIYDYSKFASNTSDDAQNKTCDENTTEQRLADFVDNSVQELKLERKNASLISEYQFHRELSTWNDAIQSTTVGFGLNTSSRFLNILSGSSTVGNTSLIT